MTIEYSPGDHLGSTSITTDSRMMLESLIGTDTYVSSILYDPTGRMTSRLARSEGSSMYNFVTSELYAAPTGAPLAIPQ